MLDPIQITVSLVFGGSLFFFIWALFRYPVQSTPQVNRRAALALGTGQRSTVFEVTALAPITSLSMTFAKRFQYTPIRELIRKDLDASGNPNSYSVDEYVATSILSAIAFTVGTAVVALLLFRRFDPMAMLILGAVGFFAPVWSLHIAATRRVMRISKKLPYTLDLIALMMGAGSSFTEAINTIIRDDPNDDLNQELQIVRAEIELGATRAIAMANLAERIPLESLRSVVGAINQAESLGSPLSAILKTQSTMMRLHRSVRAEKLSASASLRILIPSMLILMAVVLIIFGPIAIKWAIEGRPW